MLLAVLGKVSWGRLVWGAGCVYAYVCFFSFSYLRGWQYALEISQPKPWAPLSSGPQSGTVNTPYFSWNLVPIPTLGWDPILRLCSLNLSLPGHRGLLLLKLNVSKMELLEFPPTDLLLCQCSLNESTRLLRNLGATPHSPLIHPLCSIIHQLLFIMSPEWCPIHPFLSMPALGMDTHSSLSCHKSTLSWFYSYSGSLLLSFLSSYSFHTLNVAFFLDFCLIPSSHFSMQPVASGNFKYALGTKDAQVYLKLCPLPLA